MVSSLSTAFFNPLLALSEGVKVLISPISGFCVIGEIRSALKFRYLTVLDSMPIQALTITEGLQNMKTALDNVLISDIGSIVLDYVVQDREVNLVVQDREVNLVVQDREVNLNLLHICGPAVYFSNSEDFGATAGSTTILAIMIKCFPYQHVN